MREVSSSPAPDDFHRFVGDPLLGALTAARPAEIVDHDLRAVLGEHQCLAPADAISGPGHDRDLPVEHAHLRVPSRTLKTDAGVTLARGLTKPPRSTDGGTTP